MGACGSTQDLACESPTVYANLYVYVWRPETETGSCLPTLFREGRTESVDLIGTRRLNRNKYFSILVFRPGSDKAFVTTAIANSHHDH